MHVVASGGLTPPTGHAVQDAAPGVVEYVLLGQAVFNGAHECVHVIVNGISVPTRAKTDAAGKLVDGKVRWFATYESTPA